MLPGGRGECPFGPDRLYGSLTPCGPLVPGLTLHGIDWVIAGGRAALEHARLIQHGSGTYATHASMRVWLSTSSSGAEQ